MNEVLFKSPRSFKMWRYNVSHRQLLLRSTKENDTPTRVDILFKDVTAIKLHTELLGLTILKISPAEVDSIPEELKGLISDRKTLFSIESARCAGYVLAGLMEQAEDTGEYDEPSYLFSSL